MDYNVLLYSLQPWEIYQIQTPLSTLQMLWKIWDVFLKHHWFNFRLPELLDHFAKTLERVVFDQLSTFLTQNIILEFIENYSNHSKWKKDAKNRNEQTRSKNPQISSITQNRERLYSLSLSITVLILYLKQFTYEAQENDFQHCRQIYPYNPYRWK